MEREKYYNNRGWNVIFNWISKGKEVECMVRERDRDILKQKLENKLESA